MIRKRLVIVYLERIEYNQKEKDEKSQKLSRRRRYAICGSYKRRSFKPA